MFIIHTDASIEPKNPGGIIAWAYIIKSTSPPKGEVHRENGFIKADPTNTNNQGEYYAVIAALIYLLDLPDSERKPALINSDSQLVVNQCSQVWDVHDLTLSKLNTLVINATRRYSKSIKFQHIPRENNKEADLFSRSIYERKDIQKALKKLKSCETIPVSELFGDDDVPW